MKILIFNWRCWLNPAMGGAEIFTHEVAKRWIAAGHEVTVFTSRFPGCKKEEVLDGIHVVRSGGRFSVFSEAKKIYKNRFVHEGFDLLIDEINTRPFFVHTFVEGDAHVVALIHQLAREYWFFETRFPLNLLGHYFEDFWLRKCAMIPTITVSESTQKDLAALGFLRVSVVPEGLNFTPLSTPEKNSNHPIIVYAGRLTAAKRTIHAIRAFEKVKQKLPEAELWIIGDGPVKGKLMAQSGQGVKFFGQIGNVERRRLIAQSWVLVSPGVREGWGLNIIEANALGVPCVAYSVPGLQDSVQNNTTGLLVKSGDVQAMAEGLLSLLTDEKRREQYSINALKYSRNFSWDVTAREFLKIAMDTKRP
jgi:glycosyltransferase involved in cell wall biosynthesis